MRKANPALVAAVLGVLFQGFVLSTARETKSQASAAANVSGADPQRR